MAAAGGSRRDHDPIPRERPSCKESRPLIYGCQSMSFGRSSRHLSLIGSRAVQSRGRRRRNRIAILRLACSTPTLSRPPAHAGDIVISGGPVDAAVHVTKPRERIRPERIEEVFAMRYCPSPMRWEPPVRKTNVLRGPNTDRFHASRWRITPSGSVQCITQARPKGMKARVDVSQRKQITRSRSKWNSGRPPPGNLTSDPMLA